MTLRSEHRAYRGAPRADGNGERHRLTEVIRHLEACLDRSTLEAALMLMIHEKRAELRKMTLTAAFSSQDIPKARFAAIGLGIDLLCAAHDRMREPAEQPELAMAAAL